MIECPTIQKREIRAHYDLSTLFYRLLWGRHIHHGLWHADESPRQAQEQLIETLADLAELQQGERVLDVGCGMGGSSIHLARTRGCSVTGLTLSPVQRQWARLAAGVAGQRRRVQFRCQDAETAELPEGAFDLIWSVECTEHLFDKPAFFARAARWLRPGGRLAICAWLAGNEPLSDDARQLVYEVCEGFLCPSLGSADDYRAWFAAAGHPDVQYYDWTDRVLQTWEICLRRVRATKVTWLARFIDKNSDRFLRRFETILQAYRSGAMRYGGFVARVAECAQPNSP